MSDKKFNEKFEKFLLKNLSRADIAGMYVLCNEREQKYKTRIAELEAENSKIGQERTCEHEEKDGRLI